LELYHKRKKTFDLTFAKKINEIVAANDALYPGQLRTGQGGVIMGDEESSIPPKINEYAERKFIEPL
jgi:hypothetical protein